MKKGFTLIEVLAVISLMGIIIGIIYVKVDKKIDLAETSSLEESTKNYINSVQSHFINVDLTTEDLPAGKYQVASSNVIDGKTYSSMNDIIELKENRPTDGYVIVNDEGIVTEVFLVIRGYTVTFKNGKYTIEEA